MNMSEPQIHKSRYNHVGVCLKCQRYGSLSVNGWCIRQVRREVVVDEGTPFERKGVVFDCVNPVPWREAIRKYLTK